jgi:hypothetical protein
VIISEAGNHNYCYQCDPTIGLWGTTAFDYWRIKLKC